VTIVVEDSLPSLVRGWRVGVDGVSLFEMTGSVLALLRAIVELRVALGIWECVSALLEIEGMC
jgi:hypothetical protein